MSWPRRTGAVTALVVFVAMVPGVDNANARIDSSTDHGFYPYRFVQQGNETVVLFTPSETRFYYNGLKPWQRSQARWCTVPGGSWSGALRLLNRMCIGYRAWDAFKRVQFEHVRWMLRNAVAWGGCGSIHYVEGRFNRVKAATHWSRAARANISHAWTRPGDSSLFLLRGNYYQLACPGSGVGIFRT